MEEQWLILSVCTVAAMVGMFAVGYWFEGQSSSHIRKARREQSHNKD
ncbi:MAG: hypothetical protein AB8B48_06535 [Pseudomonadales bacterium]